MMEIIVELKRHAQHRGLQPPDEVRLLCEAVREFHNISGEPNFDRLRWSNNLPQPLDRIDRATDTDVLYFVGCIASFYPRAYSIAQGFGRILELAGLRFTTLGGTEWCCGYPLLHAGMVEEAGALIEHNLEQVKALGVHTLVATCPSCLHTWKKLYPGFASGASELRMIHSTELLAELMEAGRIRPGQLPEVATYHDPCDLARKCGELEAPRYVLRAIPGLELREMANTGTNALCCGGGGDVKLLDLDTTIEVALRRIEQAVDVEADVVVSSCQQCKRALTSAVQWLRRPMRVFDVVEVVWQSLADEVKW